MTIEALLGEHIAALKANTEALQAVAGNQERLIAGQAAAIEKVEATKPKRETAAEKKAREAAEKAEAATSSGDDAAPATGNAPAADPAPTASGAAAAATATNEDGPTDEQLKATAVAWVGNAADDADKKARAGFLQTMARSLLNLGDDAGLVMLTGADSKLTGEHRKKAVFFIKRAHKLGGIQHVNLSAPYEFDLAPDQDEPRVEVDAAPEADFDPLG